MKRPRTHKDQGALFGGVSADGGYINPETGEVSTHPPLCGCGNCPALDLSPADSYKLATFEVDGEQWKVSL